MKSSQLFIPKKVRVGFQNRSDTFTGKLAYVVYYDHKDVLRKEKSWEAWRDKKLDPLEIDNRPTSGFVLNRNVGGHGGWNRRNEYIRVYDPRGFEFEISVANLLFVLKETDCSRGKGLEGEFVYSWDGTELVLLPSKCEEYRNSLNFTELQGKKFDKNNLIPGASYRTRKQQTLVFLGKFEVFKVLRDQERKPGKKFLFWDDGRFEYFSNLDRISEIASETVVPNYAELVEKYYKSYKGSRIVSLSLVPEAGDTWISKHEDVYVEFSTGYDFKDKTKISYIQQMYDITLEKGFLRCVSNYGTIYRNHCSDKDWIEPTGNYLYATLESGTICRYSYCGLHELSEEEAEKFKENSK